MEIFPDWATYVFPSWAGSYAAKAWLFGVIFGALARLTRYALRWFKRAGTENVGDS